MTTRLAPILIGAPILFGALALASAGSVAAQVAHPPYGGLTVGERHRYEMDRIQQRSDRQESFARQQSLQTRQTVQDLQARRQSATDRAAANSDTVLAHSLEQQRALRESATRQRQATQAGVGQIDSWLDRPQP